MSFKTKEYLNVLFFLAFIALFIPCIRLNAEGFVTNNITINTDRERTIIIESIDDGTASEIMVDKQGIYDFQYAEPGEYHYRIYESKKDQEPDEKVYIVTVCVMVNETTGELEIPVISVDDEAGNGKPGKIEFGKVNETEPTDETTSSTEDTSPDSDTSSPKKKEEDTSSPKKKETPSTTESKPEDKTKSSPNNDKDTRAANTGDNAPIVLVLASLIGIAALAMWRKENDAE